MERGCCMRTYKIGSILRSHLSSLVLEPHLHHSNAEPRLCSQRLPHLKIKQMRRFPASREKTKERRSTLKYFASFLVFQQARWPFDFRELWMNAVVFLDLLVICLFKALAWVQACFRARLQRQLSYLSMTFAADGVRYTSLPRLTQNRVLLPTSKHSSQAGEIFLIWEFYLWNYCRSRGWNLNILPQKQTGENIKGRFSALYMSSVLPFCRVLRTPQRRPWRPVFVELSGWFAVFWASWDPFRHPPSPGPLCLSPAWCPTPHHRSSLQRETSIQAWTDYTLLVSQTDCWCIHFCLSRLHEIRQYIIKGDTCVFDTLLSIYY